MQLTYDPICNIAYIRFRRKTAKVRTIEVSDELNVDIGPDGRVYGIELLNANDQLGTQRVKQLVLENADSGRKVKLAV